MITIHLATNYMSIGILKIKMNFKVRGPFVETFCIEKDSYIDAI